MVASASVAKQVSSSGMLPGITCRTATPTSQGSRPSSAGFGDIQPLKQRMPSNSMIRLADEVPVSGIARTRSSGSLHGDLSPSRPGSSSSTRAGQGSTSRKVALILRLPGDSSDTGTPSPSVGTKFDSNPFALPPVACNAGGTRSRSNSFSGLPSGTNQASKASMLRLPDEPALPCTGVNEAPLSSTKSKLRERMGKSLVIAAPPRQEDKKSRKDAFRQLEAGETINDFYDFGEEIYSGGAKGRVLIATSKLTGESVVVKIRAKQGNRSHERTWRGIMEQMTDLGTSPHVLGISEIVEGKEEFYVVMPKCNGGELFEFLANETEVPEAECKRIIREILIAVGHLHNNGIIHRDIKPENIMFDLDLRDEMSPKTVKLIDFDTCQEWTPQTPKSQRFVGTPGYIAPEALMGRLSPQSDLWSIGVILYILMTGEMPWSSLVSLEDGLVGSRSAIEMYRAIKAEVLRWDQEPWPDFPLACDLCQQLLAFDLDKRIQSCQEALSHPWLKE